MTREDIEQAMEIATDALGRRARVLSGADPGVSEALRHLVANLERIAPMRTVTKAEIDAIAKRSREKAKEAWR